jgi:hypothetical protein
METQQMYCRVIRLKGDSTKTEQATQGWTQSILPALKREPGFAGATLAGNRMTGEGLSVAYFQTEQQVNDSRERVRAEGLKLLGATGGTIVEEDVCEVIFNERIEPARNGVYVRVTSVQTDPAKLSEAAANFKDKIVPTLHKQHGARGSFFFANRKSGKTFAGSWWDTQADLDKSELSIRDLRSESIQKSGGQHAKTEAFEIYRTEILAPAGVGR